MFSGKQNLASVRAIIILSCSAILGYAMRYAEQAPLQYHKNTVTAATPIPSGTTNTQTVARTTAPVPTIPPVVPPVTPQVVHPSTPPAAPPVNQPAVPAPQSPPATPFAFVGNEPFRNDRAGHRVSRDVAMTIQNTLAGVWSGFYRVTENVRGLCLNMDTHTFGDSIFLNLADNNGVISGTGSIDGIRILHIDENGIGTSIDLGSLQVTISGVEQDGVVDLILDPGTGGRFSRVINLHGTLAVNTLNGGLSIGGVETGRSTLLRMD